MQSDLSHPELKSGACQPRYMYSTGLWISFSVAYHSKKRREQGDEMALYGRNNSSDNYSVSLYTHCVSSVEQLVWSLATHADRKN